MTATPTRYDVIVAGGGPAGHAMALSLAHVFDGGIRVAVVDAGGPAPPDVRASALGAASRRLLQTIGVWSHLQAAAQDIDAVDLTDSRLGDAVRPVLLSYDTRLDQGEPAMTIVPNVALSDALLAGVRATAAVTRIDAVRVVGLAQTDHAARLTLSDGRVLDAALVVAADGRRSTLREAAGIKTTGWPHAQVGIVTTISHELPHRARAMQHFLPGGPFALLPLTGQRCCVTWSEDKDHAARLLGGPEADLRAAIDLRVGGRLGDIALAGPCRSWPLDTFLARGLVADRLALIGDAARGVHPIAGQGLNLGLRDVAALVDAVCEAARVGSEIGSRVTLDTYERARRADGVFAATAFDALNRLFSNDLSVLRFLRDAGLGVVGRLPALKQRLVAEAAGLTGDVPRLMRASPHVTA